MRFGKIFLILLSILILPVLASAHQRVIHVEWQYQHNGDNLAGFRLYHGNNLACEIADPDATSMDCSVDVPDGESLFTLTSYFKDGTESPPSAPFPYVFSSVLKAVLSADVLKGTSPLTVAFNANSSTGNILSYDWTFGDGETGVGSTISHVFSPAGSYNVTLKITDDQGATDQATVAIVVTSPSSSNIPPTAVVSSSSTVGDAPLQVHLDGSGSTDSDGTILSYKWDMGDGGTATGPKVTYTYTTAGSFNATLTVTDDGGLTDSISTPVIVREPPAGSNRNVPPTAVITASTSQGFAPVAISFDAGASSDSDGKIKKYTWNFGDGTRRSGVAVDHVYKQAATYTVTLKVKDNKGAVSESSTVVTVRSGVTNPSLAVELGELLLNTSWSHVVFKESFVNPVVVAGPLSYNDPDPAVVRIRNVTATGFDIRIQEWGYLDGSHAEETVDYIVMEQGSYILDNGARVEAGTFFGGARFKKHKFIKAFRRKPVLLTSVLSNNEEGALNGRIRGLSRRKFKFKLKGQDANRLPRHVIETVGYIACEQGTGAIGQLLYEVGRTRKSVSDKWHSLSFRSPFTAKPFFFAGIQGYRGRNNATVRYQNLTAKDVQVKVEEETSRRKAAHRKEVIGYMVFTSSAQ
ncbi:MAG: PKD domain-containing protein [Deltaproteobacteria bacterium]|nr:PKD domain-containing protein [Deltaproteobacteria bacterium]